MTFKRIIGYFFTNGAAATFLYFGVVKDVNGAGNIYIAWAWFSFIVGSLILLATVLLQALITERKAAIAMLDSTDPVEIPVEGLAAAKLAEIWKSIPRWWVVLDLIYDFTILGTLVWFGWWVTSVVYGLHVIVVWLARESAKTIRTEMWIAEDGRITRIAR